MYDINHIMDMLDWNNNEDIQNKGIILSKKIPDLTVFFQPNSEKHNKNVWDNCAKIISSKTDEELNPYLILMFEWLQDMNWPGAITIYNRLMNMNFCSNYQVFLDCLNNAIKKHDDSWEMWLCKFAKEYDDKYELSDNVSLCLKCTKDNQTQGDGSSVFDNSHKTGDGSLSSKKSNN